MIKTQILSVRKYFISVNLFWLASKTYQMNPYILYLTITLFNSYLYSIPIDITCWSLKIIFFGLIFFSCVYVCLFQMFKLPFLCFIRCQLKTRQFFPTLYLVHSSIRFEIYSCICWSWTICIFSYNLLSFLQLICFLDRPASNWLELNLNQNDLKIRTKRYVYKWTILSFHLIAISSRCGTRILF